MLVKQIKSIIHETIMNLLLKTPWSDLRPSDRTTNNFSDPLCIFGITLPPSRSPCLSSSCLWRSSILYILVHRCICPFRPLSSPPLPLVRIPHLLLQRTHCTTYYSLWFSSLSLLLPPLRFILPPIC